MFDNVEFLSSFKDFGLMGVILAVLAYFVYKDMTLNKALNDALNKFTIAINVLINRGDN